MKKELNPGTALTGVWNGLYSIRTLPNIPESLFVAVLIDSGSRLSGTIHEGMNDADGAFYQTNAHVVGRSNGGKVRFVKTYDGTAGLSHDVEYEGTVGENNDEISGEWSVETSCGMRRGPFMMIRARVKDVASVIRQSIRV